MSKTATPKLPKELLEQIYAEVETRVERKFSARIEALERKVDEAKESARIWQNKYFKEKDRSQELRDDLSLANAEIKGLKTLVEKQAAEIAGLKKQIYHRKTEKTPQPDVIEAQPKRSRGAQHGRKGHGRKIRPLLDTEDCVHAFSAEERICKKCNQPYKSAGSKSSEEITVTFRVVRVIHKRETVVRTCKCDDSPRVKTMRTPPKLFKGSLFSTEFWQYIIYDKYHLQRPLNRVRSFLESHGLEVSQGTLTNGLKRLHQAKVFKPLVDEIATRIASSVLIQMDETRWKIFQELEGKKGYQHWLWVKLATDCALYTIDPSRSTEAAKHNLNFDPVVVVSDMLAAYKGLGDHVTNAWCWAHVRRYVLGLTQYPKLKKAALAWVARIDALYHSNNQRRASKSDQEFEKHDTELRALMTEFERLAKSYAKRAKHPEAKRVFKMISKHWAGLSVFVELSDVPMDNNASENALRNAAVGRKCYYGSGSQWSGELAADLFSIFKTLELNGINPRQWLLEYLTAVANNDGQAPADAASFLPWNSPPAAALHS